MIHMARRYKMTCVSNGFYYYETPCTFSLNKDEKINLNAMNFSRLKRQAIEAINTVYYGAFSMPIDLSARTVHASLLS